MEEKEKVVYEVDALYDQDTKWKHRFIIGHPDYPELKESQRADISGGIYLKKGMKIPDEIIVRFPRRKGA